MSRIKHTHSELYPIGLLGGAKEFEHQYPKEMMRLGCLSAYWSLLEDSLCHVLAALLGDREKATAAYYSTTNHKARRDMIKAVATKSSISDQAATYLNAGLATTAKAADARNALLHGLFRMEPISGELVAIKRQSATKVPEITRKGILREIDDSNFAASSLASRE